LNDLVDPSFFVSTQGCKQQKQQQQQQRCNMSVTGLSIVAHCGHHSNAFDVSLECCFVGSSEKAGNK